MSGLLWQQEPKTQVDTLAVKIVLWLLAIFVAFEGGLQLGLKKGRELGRMEEKLAVMEEYRQIVSDAGYRVDR